LFVHSEARIKMGFISLLSGIKSSFSSGEKYYRFVYDEENTQRVLMETFSIVC